MIKTCNNDIKQVWINQKLQIRLTRINELTKKDVPFVWGDAQQEAFILLKDKLTHAPLLQLPNFNKTFELKCDASGIGLGGVLLQDGKPVAYFSEKLSWPSLNYSTYSDFRNLATLFMA